MPSPEIRDICNTQAILAIRHNGEELSNGIKVNDVIRSWISQYAIPFGLILKNDTKGELDLTQIHTIEKIEKILYGTHERKTINEIVRKKNISE